MREALTNVMRHADGATRVTVALDHSPGRTAVTVVDDGAAARPVAYGGSRPNRRERRETN